MTTPSSDEQLADTWSVDPTIRFNDIHIIESLGPRFSDRTGTRLHENLESWCFGTPVRAILHQIESRADLDRLLCDISVSAASGRYPLLHFETHGEEGKSRQRATRGIILSSGEHVAWRQLAPILTRINEATRLHLVVFMAACNGLDLVTLLQPTEPTPVRIVIGPMDVIAAGTIEKVTRAFYQTLLRENNGNAATRAVQDVLEPDDGMVLSITAEWLFMKILEGYYNELTTDVQVAARAERMIAAWALQGVPAAELGRRRKFIKAHLVNRHAVFDKCYSKFFMVDKYPENAKRFIMSFDRCFQEAARNA